MNYWLMKCEPSAYSIDDLSRDGKTQWEGVRNYQARNIMRDDMKVGDLVFFYHSNTDPPGIVGLCEVVREGYPDYFAWNEDSKYFDPRSTEDKPVWYMVDIVFKKKFSELISLEALKSFAELSEMRVTQKGSRLSVQPVDKAHFEFILGLAGKLPG